MDSEFIPDALGMTFQKFCDPALSGENGCVIRYGFFPLDSEGNNLGYRCDHRNNHIIELLLIECKGSCHGVTELLFLVIRLGIEGGMDTYLD